MGGGSGTAPFHAIFHSSNGVWTGPTRGKCYEILCIPTRKRNCINVGRGLATSSLRG